MNAIVLTESEQFRRNFIGKEIKCLDHGFVKVMDIMGNDYAVVEAARTSYGVGTKKVSEDKGLISYLMRHHHTTPFEMCEIKLLCQMPLFVARQWVRHRTANINEYSMRYSDPINCFYVPKAEHIGPQSKTNKQGRDKGEYSKEEIIAIQGLIEDVSKNCFNGWSRLANEPDAVEDDYCAGPGHGLARELSRMVLPVNAYTKWVWKIDINNLMKFLVLRMDSHAQYEIRVYANAIAEFVKEWMPWTWEAFEDHWLNSVTFSSKESVLLKHMLSGTLVDALTPDMSKGAYAEFLKKIMNIQK